MTASCTDCQKPLGRSLFSILSKNDYPCGNSDCTARLCKTCGFRRPLMSFPADGADDVSKGTIQNYCNQCFEDKSTVDYSKTYEIFEGTSNIVWLFAHGASGCRQMFVPHAKELQAKFHHSSILIDLAGHASQLDVPLTLDSATKGVETVLKECDNFLKDKKFVGSVLMDCGQNVGPGASLKARIGLVVLRWIGKNCSNATMMNLMLGETKKSPADYHLIETVFGAGMWFDQAEAHVECLKSVAPAEYLPRINLPILFMNGTEDYRDSEDRWLELCVKKEQSELKVYDGGDHFFHARSSICG